MRLYTFVYRCDNCGWRTEHYSQIDEHENTNTLCFVTGQMEEVSE